MKTVGVMRVHDCFTEEVDLTISALAAFVDEICFQTHRVTDVSVLAAMDRCRNCVGSEEYSRDEWSNCYALDQAYHFACSFGADWIVSQDQDELLPFPQLHNALEEMSSCGANTLVLPPVHCWGTPERIVSPLNNRTGDHAKAYRAGTDGWTIVDGGGCLMPATPHVIYNLRYPYRHLAFMTEASRETRKTVGGGRTRREAWQDEDFKVYPFRYDWTIEQFTQEARNAERQI